MVTFAFVNALHFIVVLFFQPDYDDIDINGRVPTQFPRGKSDKGKDNKKYGKQSTFFSFLFGVFIIQ